ncbi:MAG: ABC transporter substrate-binding protein [Hyphomicrobiales bacterium]|nr:ABC transporter substrate-binding protein [Hyphomicrobiales bacterium]
MTEFGKSVTAAHLSRRRFLKRTALASAALAAPAIWTSARAERKIVMRDPGGPFTPGFGAAFYEPFEKETGIKVVGLQSSHEPTGQIKAMIEAKNYTWDGASLSKASHQALVNLGYLEEIAPKGGPGANLSKIPESMRTPHLMGTDVYASLIAYRTDTMGKAPPKNWKDLWDIKGVPGTRALRKHPFDTMEAALMADGVAPGDLYPIDFDRAFKSLDKIKNDVAIWWTGGAQTSQLLKTGEVDCLFTWNGRAQVAIDDGAPVELVWDQALWTFEGWTILKGGPNVDLVREFIEFCAQGKQQALYTPHVAYGPTAPDAYEFVDPERAKVLPTNPAYIKNMVNVDTDFWGKNKESASEKFNAWLLS